MSKIIELEKRRKKRNNDHRKSAGLTINHPRVKLFLAIIKDIRSRALPPKTIKKIANKLAKAFSPPISNIETNLCVYHEIQKKTTFPQKTKIDSGLILYNIENGLQNELITRGDAQEILKTIKIWYNIDLSALKPRK